MTVDTNEKLREKVQRLPSGPGVYLMKDARGRVLYVGKAVNLRSRVRSYFGKSSDTRVFHQFLVKKIADVDCIVAESEAEALILENNLIKKYRPPYNIRLKDDKTYVSVAVTLAEEWPRVMATRRYKKDGNRYFGPFGRAGAVREMLRLIKTVFPLRTCSNGFFRSRTRPCIEYEIGRCTAPCVGLISRDKYMEDVDDVILFLRGRNRDLEAELTKKMEAASRERRYELAARYRDQIDALRRVFEAQKAQEYRLGDLDVFGSVREGEHTAVQELVVREGKIVHSRCHVFRTAIDRGEVLSSFLSQYYMTDRYVPPEILTSEDLPDASLLESWLTRRRGGRTRLRRPRKGDRAGLIELALKNAQNSLQIERGEEERLEAILRSLGRHLGLAETPRKIECYDISNFQGSLTVGAMVSFRDGKPAKDRYRKFRIQTVVGADDFSSIKEVLTRRLRRGLENRDLPDLMVIDGGKGQLSAATQALSDLGVEGVRVVSLAKERRRRGTTERLFVPERSAPLDLSQDSAESLLLQRIRDEAHRFAVSYHRELRRRDTLRTGLEGIPGIGKKRRQALIDRFGTLRGIRAASEADIAAVIGARLARSVVERLGIAADGSS